MSTTAAQHAAHLDAEHAEGDRLEAESVERWRDLAELADLGLPLEPPLSPEDEEAFPPDPREDRSMSTSEPFTFAEAADYLGSVTTMRGSGLPEGRTARMRECVALLRRAAEIATEREGIEHVLWVADHCDDTAGENDTLADRVRELAAEAGRPIADPVSYRPDGHFTATGVVIR